MRRRIIEDCGTIYDVTLRPHDHVSEHEPGKVVLDDDPPLVLYDDALWAEFKAAETHLARVKAKVWAAAKPEPLDETEIRVGCALWHAINQFVPFQKDEVKILVDGIATLENELLAHANAFESDHSPHFHPPQPTHLVVIVREPGMEPTIAQFFDYKEAEVYAGEAGAQWSHTYVCLIVKGPLT
jgi:hypothetical protein